MKEWLLVWWTVVSFPVACPGLSADPYTGASAPNAMCAVNHVKTEKHEMVKWFDSEKEADDFKKDAPEEIKNRMVLIHAVDVKPETRSDVGDTYSMLYAKGSNVKREWIKRPKKAP